MQLKKIGVLSLGKIGGLFGVIYGLILGILLSIVLAKAGNIPELMQQLGMLSKPGYSAMIVLPVIYGIGYFVVAAITALIYNLLAGWVGGIEVEFKGKK
jgi:ABC-type lipoprotein release transport system permease subunit